jgi:SPP1 family predicted phage head-tail adaptor
MNRSKMDRQVTILVYQDGVDAAGGPVQDWVEGDTEFVQKEDQTGREFTAAAQTNAQMTTRFWMDWRSDLTPKDRLRLIGEDQGADVEYDILAIREVGRRDGIEITGQARV